MYEDSMLYKADPKPTVVYRGSNTWSAYSRFGGPVGVMVDFLKRNQDSETEWFVKVDNDVVVCPGWLNVVDELIRFYDKFDLLGMEARFGEDSSQSPLMFDKKYPKQTGQRFTPKADFIGGVGAMRYSTFSRFPDLGRHGLLSIPEIRYHGFGQWQTRHPEIKKAWIDPPLPTFLLDHLPFEPWKSLSERYIVEGIQRRQWGEYGEEYSKLWEWWEPDWKEKR
jgi:hypothetical protein